MKTSQAKTFFKFIEDGMDKEMLSPIPTKLAFVYDPSTQSWHPKQTENNPIECITYVTDSYNVVCCMRKPMDIQIQDDKGNEIPTSKTVTIYFFLSSPTDLRMFMEQTTPDEILSRGLSEMKS